MSKFQVGDLVTYADSHEGDDVATLRVLNVCPSESGTRIIYQDVHTAATGVMVERSLKKVQR